MTRASAGLDVLILDTDPDTTAAIRALLRTRVEGLYSIQQAAELPPDSPSDFAARHVVFVGIDTRSGDVASAAQLIREAIARGALAPLALLTGTRSPDFEDALLDAGAADVCWKEELSAPLLESQIRHAVARVSARSDATERQAAEGALRQSEARLRETLREREALERQFYQAQKMETVGRLAGGIAHDFNNILTAIVGFGTLAAEQVAHDEVTARNVQEILKAAGRASALTQQLLAFGRRQVLHPVALNLSDTVRALAIMSRGVIGEDVDLQLRMPRDLPLVRADQSQLESTIMNLVANANDAMPHGGRLTIETNEVTLDQDYCHTHVSVRPGHYVALAVSDTGVGIPYDLQHRIFEPFFTTKEAGKGSGLGLATAYGIIKQSGGYIWVYSEPEVGTTFKIYLPVDTRERPATPRPLVGSAPVRGGGETILLVEDASVIRQLAREVIGRAGYHVLEAGSAEQALTVASRHEGRIHLLLTDVIMPGASGVELASQLKTIRSDVHVLFMSGYADNAIVRSGLLAGEAAFLQKPFTPEDLLRKVRQVLEVSRQ